MLLKNVGNIVPSSCLWEVWNIPVKKKAATGESRLERESLNSRNLPFLLVE